MPEIHIHWNEDDTTGNGVILIPELNMHLQVVKNATSSPNHTHTVVSALRSYYEDWGYRVYVMHEAYSETV